MSSLELSLADIYDLSKRVMLANGCDTENAEAVADIITRAERDGSHSHGLFRVPGYVKALRSGKVDGKAKPSVKIVTPAILQVDGNGCFAPIAQAFGLPELVKVTNDLGIGALSLVGVHHFAALWPETEYLADRGLVGIARTAYTPAVAPTGSKKALFGTNPISFACSLALGTIQLSMIWLLLQWQWVMSRLLLVMAVRCHLALALTLKVMRLPTLIR